MGGYLEHLWPCVLAAAANEGVRKREGFPAARAGDGRSGPGVVPPGDPHPARTPEAAEQKQSPPKCE